jgi:hypothetical protein
MLTLNSPYLLHSGSDGGCGNPVKGTPPEARQPPIRDQVSSRRRCRKEKDLAQVETKAEQLVSGKDLADSQLIPALIGSINLGIACTYSNLSGIVLRAPAIQLRA